MYAGENKPTPLNPKSMQTRSTMNFMTDIPFEFAHWKYATDPSEARLLARLLISEMKGDEIDISDTPMTSSKKKRKSGPAKLKKPPAKRRKHTDDDSDYMSE